MLMTYSIRMLMSFLRNTDKQAFNKHFIGGYIMKKVFSFLMALSLLLCCAGAVQAASYKKCLFETKFTDYYAEMGGDITSYNYDELFYHFDDNGEIDWCLISASGDTEPGICHGVFDDIIITGAGSVYPFAFGLAVYDVAADEFYDICTAWDMDFAQLSEAFYNTMTDENVSYGYGNVQILGDVDKNGVLNIADATKIQKYSNELIPRDDMLNVEFSTLKYGFSLTCLSDYNKDGYCNIADATSIQKKIANID